MADLRVYVCMATPLWVLKLMNFLFNGGTWSRWQNNCVTQTICRIMCSLEGLEPMHTPYKGMWYTLDTHMSPWVCALCSWEKQLQLICFGHVFLCKNDASTFILICSLSPSILIPCQASVTPLLDKDSFILLGLSTMIAESCVWLLVWSCVFQLLLSQDIDLLTWVDLTTVSS